MVTIAATPSRSKFEICAPMTDDWREILSPAAVEFIIEMARTFGARREALLQRRAQRQSEFDAGGKPAFLAQTEHVRQADWKVAPIPPDLMDRRVEITGPVDRKMIINALNSGANVFMADFEDSNSPTWSNVLDGQVNLYDAVRRRIHYVSPEGKRYQLGDNPATLVVRPRGWHLSEKHVKVDGTCISASIFDFGLYFFHNARELLARGSGPYFYLPKLESHLEARLWNDIFLFAQERMGIPRGSVRATVLIETIPAAFEMDEILYELREHSAGLNCGRWDYMFSFVRSFRRQPDCLLPDRQQVTMEQHFLKSYVELLIQTCHRRGIHAMGGMAAQIPIKNDPAANERALARVRADKLREVRAGHDGTWVAHPGLVPIAREIFDGHMAGPHQIGLERENVSVSEDDLLKTPEGTITEEGLRRNLDVGIQYLESWLRGSGCVPIYHLMEDAATAEICRAQVWQWVKFGAKLADGCRITETLVQEFLADQVEQIWRRVGAEQFNQGQFRVAADLMESLSLDIDFPEFLTLVAYDCLP